MSYTASNMSVIVQKSRLNDHQSLFRRHWWNMNRGTPLELKCFIVKRRTYHANAEKCKEVLKVGKEVGNAVCCLVMIMRIPSWIKTMGKYFHCNQSYSICQLFRQSNRKEVDYRVILYKTFGQWCFKFFRCTLQPRKIRADNKECIKSKIYWKIKAQSGVRLLRSW